MSALDDCSYEMVPDFDWPADAKASVVYEVLVLRGSDKAILVRFGGGKERWIPRSQLFSGTTVADFGDKGRIVIPHWLSERVEGVLMETATIEEVECKRETDKAILCLIDGEEHWIPKSQVDDDSEVYAVGHSGKLVVSQWLADQKGIG